MSLWWSALLELVFPRHCAGCGARGADCCDSCFARLPRAPRLHPEAVVLFDYHDPTLRQLIWRLKYRGAASIAARFATRLREEILEELDEQTLWSGTGNKEMGGTTSRRLVVPVPLAPRRLKRRGFNQAAAIAEALARLDPQLFEYAPRLLVKTRETRSQVQTHSRAERERNLRGAFALAAPAAHLAGRSVILIDDVITTGATLRAAGAPLQAASVQSILAVALAG